MIKLSYSNTAQRGDLVRADDLNLETDESLETAVTISLFSDARADDGDDIPVGADKRGWWGSAYLTPEGRQLGSKVWQLLRAKATRGNLNRAASVAKDALQWMIEAKVASEINAVLEPIVGRPDVLALRITIQRPSKIAPRWERYWEVQLGL